MVIYHVCFTHNRLSHPQRRHWAVLHDLPHHDRLHLAAARCDLCPEACPDGRTADSRPPVPHVPGVHAGPVPRTPHDRKQFTTQADHTDVAPESSWDGPWGKPSGVRRYVRSHETTNLRCLSQTGEELPLASFLDHQKRP